NNDHATSNLPIIPIYFIPVAPLVLPSFVEVPSSNWLYSFLKIHTFGLYQHYSRILFLDLDALLIHSLPEIFNDAGNDITLTGVADQWDGCWRRNVFNGGLIVIRPSAYLYTVAMQMIEYPESS